MDLGAPPLTSFLKVTLPLIWPAIASGFLLAFTLSLDDLVIASFATGPGATTLPIRIYSEVRLGVKPEINAICTLLIAIVALGVGVAALLNRRRELRREAVDLTAKL
jgi:putrescine transport system permease protein